MSKIKVLEHYKKIKNVVGSATLALLLSVVFFWYETSSNTKETAEIVDNLVQIQNSLSTQPLGVFPEYLGNINNLLNEVIVHQAQSETQDSIIICEDVLYYGIRSDVNGFQEMIRNLITLSNIGSHVTIAFYDIKGRPFKQMIKNSFISSDFQQQYRNDLESYDIRMRGVRYSQKDISNTLSRKEVEREIVKIVDKEFDGYITKNRIHTMGDTGSKFIQNIFNRRYVDSVLCEKYYKETCKANLPKFKKKIESLSRPMPKFKEDGTLSVVMSELYENLDSISSSKLNKPIEQITYDEIEAMYKGYALELYNLLIEQPNIEMIPLKEDLAMCCWMSVVNGKSTAIIAFPSKYSTDEIGFRTQDDEFIRYINTMLKGIRITHNMPLE